MEGYEAAAEGAVLIVRGEDRLLRLEGRAPTRMLNGMVTGAMPPDLEAVDDLWAVGRMPYSAMLTAKGGMITDLSVARLENGEKASLLLRLPVAGLDGALDHFRRFLPPRFAEVKSPEPSGTVMTLIGPSAPELLEETRPTHDSPTIELAATGEGDSFFFADGSELGLHIVRTGDVESPAFHLLGDPRRVGELCERLERLGVSCLAPDAGHRLWTTLRLERGRPEFGVDIEVGTLLPEAGIQRRAVDAKKGCYTGQEVVVRIRDRGHVNRRLCAIAFGGAPTPKTPAPLHDEHSGRVVGEVRSAAFSPRFDQPIGLAYVRRAIEAPAKLRLGATDGPEVAVHSLDDDGWNPPINGSKGSAP